MVPARVISGPGGQNRGVEETSPTTQSRPGAGSGTGEPEVISVLDGDVARLTLSGELTGGTRRPLVRVLTDLLLQHHSLHRVELDLQAVTYMNSAGMAVLVQALRMTAPRAIDVVLVGPPAAVIRPLQLSGLWHRFTVLDQPPGGAGGN